MDRRHVTTMTEREAREVRRRRRREAADTALVVGLALLAVIQGSLVAGGVIVGIGKMFAALLSL